MMFPDFPFDPRLNSFLPHQEVLRYLESYCQSHNIRPHIQFGTAVQKVSPVSVMDSEVRTTWEVTSSDTSGCQKTQAFDAVFVCTGHYSDPHIPNIPGMENFKGKVLHSHEYRYPEPFAGQSVVVLGAGPSGLDISFELAAVGAQVTLSHGLPRFTFPLPPEIQQAHPVVAVQGDGSLRFQDGSVGVAEVLMLCTGYIFRFPFLGAAQLGLEVKDHLVSPLYRFMMPPAFPSLFIIGICQIICPFPHFHIQVQFALAVLDGSVPLPPRAEMEAEVQQELEEKLKRGVKWRHLLKLGRDQWHYCETLACTAGFPSLPPVIHSLYEEVFQQRRIHPQNYRKHNYRLISDTEWELVEVQE
ncbi:flavin-containing monooxygenase FMO GS-OX4 isoform X2 [Thalassophryne amazonica]|nr:flavin-containing monooxygenase FMO GS-OX4 isoform X2 [Thalassophryne amazonica]